MGEALKAAIAFDSRNNSKSFARKVAEVLSANGVHTFLFEDLRPTPELSFAVRELGCDFGIVLDGLAQSKRIQRIQSVLERWGPA